LLAVFQNVCFIIQHQGVGLRLREAPDGGETGTYTGVVRQPAVLWARKPAAWMLFVKATRQAKHATMLPILHCYAQSGSSTDTSTGVSLTSL
jgi:hypothetical protein